MEQITIIVLLYLVAISTYQVYSVRNSTKQRYAKLQPILVDTSVLIDGRIVAVAESGLINSPLLIPRSVIGELQLLADGSDSEKRTRARHGLDVVSILQGLETVRVDIYNDGESAPEGVDNRLLKLAKQLGASLFTIDYNLNKVARVEDIKVINVNDLAMSLRMAYLPGETRRLELTQKGNDSHQAIGHLEDGTMVVVEHASKLIGKTAEIEFIRSLQTAAGKMMFARLVKTGNDQKQVVTSPKTKANPKKSTKPSVAQPAKKNSGRSVNRHQKQKPLTNEERLVELANGK
ncbi:hypothetical protein B7Y94_03785 [Candidatus Saccharibacteria bacterium 32-49-12]|nr:MAG: hypothetical protein B7Y94_03785 [Candidatus Saccharibacteria bacterium 32-49-12]